MKIILKYIIKSSMEKKFRTLLIILAIAVSGALLYASFAIKANLEVTYTESFLQLVGNADIMVTTNKDSPSWYVPNQLAKKLSEDCKYITQRIDRPLDYKVKTNTYEPITITGMNLEDYKKTNSLVLLDNLDAEPFEGNKIIISEYTADYYDLQLGDSMDFMINKRLRSYKVVGIAAAEGMFINESMSKFGLVPYGKLSNYLDSNRYPTTIYFKAKDESQIEDMINRLQELYPKFEVKEPFTQKDLDEKTGIMSVALLFIAIMLSFMSIFIIYSSFKVIMMQKLPCLGTFRSVGADQKKINQVMLIESTAYGLIGGIFACIMGVLISYILNVVTMPEQLKEIGTKVELVVEADKLLLAFLASNAICFFSTIFPIMQISKMPIKEIVLGETTKKRKNKGQKTLLGLLLLCIGAITPKYTESSMLLSILGMTISMPTVILGSIYILPGASKLVCRVLEPLIHLLFGNVGSVAIKNVRKDKSLLNSATLIMIGVSVLLMVNTLTTNLTENLIAAIADLQLYDVEISFDEMDDSDMMRLSSYNEVSDVLGMYDVQDVPVTGMDNNITTVEGIKDASFFNNMAIDVIGDKEALSLKLQEDRNVIITTTLQKRNQLKIGDSIEIDFDKFNGKKRNYTVIGVADTVMEAGSYLLVGQKYLQMDTGNYFYTSISMHLYEPKKSEELMVKLQKDFKDKYPDVSNGAEFRQSMKSSMQEITSLITGFAFIAIIVGGVGIINNFVISFIERKRSLAVLRSIGMSKDQVVKMLVIEAAMIGIIGSLVGVLGGVLTFNITPLFMTIGNVDMKMLQCPDTFIYYLIGSMLVAIVASSSPVKSSSKLNIIEGIKYE